VRIIIILIFFFMEYGGAVLVVSSAVFLHAESKSQSRVIWLSLPHAGLPRVL
jgi:hypothetical protein